MNDSVAFITVKVACKHGNFGCDIWVRILRKYTCNILFIAIKMLEAKPGFIINCVNVNKLVKKIYLLASFRLPENVYTIYL